MPQVASIQVVEHLVLLKLLLVAVSCKFGFPGADCRQLSEAVQFPPDLLYVVLELVHHSNQAGDVFQAVEVAEL